LATGFAQFGVLQNTTKPGFSVVIVIYLLHASHLKPVVGNRRIIQNMFLVKIHWGLKPTYNIDNSSVVVCYVKDAFVKEDVAIRAKTQKVGSFIFSVMWPS
jgi:hypothetical protein